MKFKSLTKKEVFFPNQIVWSLATADASKMYPEHLLHAVITPNHINLNMQQLLLQKKIVSEGQQLQAARGKLSSVRNKLGASTKI